MLVVKYEDLRLDTFGELQRVLTFLGCKADATRIRNAIANSSLERMRMKEDAARNMPKNQNEVGRFVRSGSTGGWKDKIPPDLLQMVDTSAGEMLAKIGYPLAFGHSTKQLAVS